MIGSSRPITEAFLQITKKQLDNIESVGKFKDNPVGYATEQLGLKLWDQQADLLTDVRDNRRVVVEAGKGVGKSLDAAVLTCWWLDSYDEATVITIGLTHSQVQNVIWQHIRHFAKRAKFGVLPLETPLWKIADYRRAIGLSPRRSSQEDIATMQGYHSPNLLVIMDEAPGMPRILWDGVEGLAVGHNNRILAIGNPISQSGPFWNACNSEYWKYRRMSCLDHPNVKTGKDVIPGAVSRAFVERMMSEGNCVKTDGPGSEAFEWPPDSGEWYIAGAVFQSQVLGIAPTEAQDQLIRLSWVTNAMTWELEGEGQTVLGLDPSRVISGDAAAMVARCGGQVLWVKRRQVRSADPGGELAGWVMDELRKTGATKAFIDEIGIGASVVDAARRKGIPVMGVNFGGSAQGRTRFANKRAECWYRVREALQGGAMSLPDDQMLSGDLTAPKFWYDGQGRIYLESKEQIRSRLGRSPDSGDALALTYGVADMGALTQKQREAMVEKAPGRWADVGVKPAGRGGRWRRG